MPGSSFRLAQAGALCLVLALTVMGCAAGDKEQPDPTVQEASMTASVELTKEFLDAHRVPVPKISVHDPTIFQDRDGKYYIVGTHITSARSDDLIQWVNTDEIFRGALNSETMKQIRAYNDDFKAGSPVGYLWAPDLIYNETMGKYCIYLSANGDHWQSNIVLLTGDQ